MSERSHLRLMALYDLTECLESLPPPDHIVRSHDRSIARPITSRDHAIRAIVINPQDLAREAIERLVEYDDWFVREVEKGLAQIPAGQTLTHDEVGARLNKHLTGRQPRR